MSYYLELFFLVATLVAVAAAFIQHRYNYWKRRNVPYLKPRFPVGNNSTFFPKGIAIGWISKYFYDEFKKIGCKIGGVFLGLDPQLVVMDPAIAKDIMTTDFAHFIDRGIYKIERDPITVHSFSQTGIEWKNGRAKSTSLFTSAKMRMFLETIKNRSEEMVESLDKYAKDNSDVDMLEVFACYTTDAIGSTVLGLECNSLKDPDAEFRKFGRHVFEEFTTLDQIKLFFTINLPKIAEKLGLSNIQPEVSDFYCKTVKGLVKYREEHKIKRNDFLQMLIDMGNSMDEILGQTFLFFIAGFETSSTTATLTLFELAQDSEAQDKVRNELLDCKKKYDNHIPYEVLMGLKYLNAAISETLRKWPPLTTITRVCAKDYTFRNTDITVKKDTTVIIPVLGFQTEPEYYPNPLKWDMERFTDKNTSHPAYFPFGEGPRMCTGMRFGQMQIKMGLLAILTNYRIHSSPSTSIPLELEPDTFVLHTKQKVYLRLEKL